jgi:hypothetical protein
MIDKKLIRTSFFVGEVYKEKKRNVNGILGAKYGVFYQLLIAR